MLIQGTFEEIVVGKCSRENPKTGETEFLVADMRDDADNALAGMKHFPGGAVSSDMRGYHTDLGVPIQDTAIRQHMKKVGVDFVIGDRAFITLRRAYRKDVGTRNVVTFWYLGQCADPHTELVVAENCEIKPGSARWETAKTILEEISTLGDFACGRLPDSFIPLLVTTLQEKTPALA